MLSAAVSAVGCGDDASGTGDARVEVLLEAEDVIVSGLQAGDDVENIHDGWNVTFDKYVAMVGHVELHLPSADASAHDESIFAVDLTSVEQNGLALWEISDLKEGRWDFSYTTHTDDAQRHDSVSADDFTTLVDEGWNFLIEGLLAQDAGVSCPPSALAEIPADAIADGENAGGDTCYLNEAVRFAFGAEAETLYGPCEIDGLPGVAATSGTTTTAAITLHGDHLFFNGFPEGSEGGVIRLAQWLADCDLNLDGEVTQEELEAIQPGDLPVLDDRYQLGGSPITPLDSMYTYVRAQLKTQGHFQGEGPCALDGVEHDHE